MKRRLCTLTLIFVFLCQISSFAVETGAEGAISVDFETGEVYYEKNADKMLVPASMTKIMTLYLLFEKIENENIPLDTQVTISENAAKLSVEPGVSNIPLKAGGCMSVDDLIDSVGVYSACATAVVVAEYVSGSETEFVKLMNETAASMNLQAKFADSSGLSDYNRITPRSVSILVRNFIEKYPDILSYTAKTSAVIGGRTYPARNKLLALDGTNYFYAGADGFKTGTTTLAGACITVTAQNEDARIIAVIMNAAGDAQRYNDATRVLNNAFETARYKNSNLFATDILAFIDGNEIPCCYAPGKTQTLCIIAEDLNFYGFDTFYDPQVETLYIRKNDNKEISPKKAWKEQPGAAVHAIYTHHDIKVVFVNEAEQIPLKTAFSLNGQCAISFDELGALYTKTWNDETRIADIYTK